MSILFRVAALTGAVFMAACSGAKESSTQSELPPQPPMWVVSDADSEITLYPTIHILPDGVTWKSEAMTCLLYTSPSPRDLSTSRMPSSA